MEEATFSAQSESGGTVGRRIRVLFSVVTPVMKWLKILHASGEMGLLGFVFLYVHIELEAAAAAASQR